MDNSNLSLDLYPLIIEYLDWSSLNIFKRINSFCHHLSQKELRARLKHTHYPFGEKNSQIKIWMNDIYIDRIYCSPPDFEDILIDPKTFSTPYLTESLSQWFHYSFQHQKWILTGKLIKPILRLNNKLVEKDRISSDILCLTFAFKDNKSYLSSIN